MIVVDTNVLVYAVSDQHPLVEPSRRLVEAATARLLRATTTTDVIQEFAHVRTRRYGRRDAVRDARRYAALLGPLITVDENDLDDGLQIYERNAQLDSFDAVLAAAAINRDADALVSADRAFAGIRRLRHVDPATPALDELISSA